MRLCRTNHDDEYSQLFFFALVSEKQFRLSAANALVPAGTVCR